MITSEPINLIKNHHAHLEMNKFEIQDEEYSFPYHYLATIKNKTPSIHKRLSWGIEYLTYIEYIRSFIETNKPKSILDIGCGDGYLINSIPFDKTNNFIGIDLSNKAIQFANAFSDGYQFKCINLFELKQEFELITLIEVIEHIPDNLLTTFIKESFSKVKKGGHLIISVPTTVERTQRKHYRHYDESLLEQQIDQPNFTIVEQKRLYKKSKLLERIIKFSQSRNSKTIKRWVWAWHKQNTFFSDKENGKHLVTIYQRIK